jgi:hypothetical protein
MTTVVPDLALVPLVLAVTGHRDVPADDWVVLSASVLEQMRALSAQHPNSPGLLLSGLAEGADRLVARCALEAGWALGVVLPLPQSDYEADFSDERSVADFRELIARAAWCRDISEASAVRPACYDALGDWLARHSQVLIALWDGREGKGLGGTADVVKRFREGVPQERLIAPDAGPVIHVLTRRVGGADLPDGKAPGNVQHLAAQPGGVAAAGEQARWTAALQRIEQFNRDARLANAAGLLAGIEGSSSLPACPVASGQSVHSPARALFLVADAMAMQAQRERSLMSRALLTLGAAAIVLAQTYSGLFTLPVLLCGAIGLSCIGIGWYRVSQSRCVEQRYLDYRALAEACKVQYFWDVAGVRECVSDHYLREQHDELEWIRHAIRTTVLTSPAAADVPLPQRLQWVRESWIEDQRRYFLGDGGQRMGKAALNRQLDEIWSRRTASLVMAGALLMVLTAVFHVFFADLSISSHDWALRSLMVGFSLIFGAAGLCKVHQQTSAFAEHAKKYERMGQTLQTARTRLDAALAAGHCEQAAVLIQAFGIEALAENGDWLLLHRDRPVSAQGFG